MSFYATQDNTFMLIKVLKTSLHIIYLFLLGPCVSRVHELRTYPEFMLQKIYQEMINVYFKTKYRLLAY